MRTPRERFPDAPYYCAYIYSFYCFSRWSINRGDDPADGGPLSLSRYLFAFYLARAMYSGGKFRWPGPRKNTTTFPEQYTRPICFVASPPPPYRPYRQNLAAAAADSETTITRFCETAAPADTCPAFRDSMTSVLAAAAIYAAANNSQA